MSLSFFFRLSLKPPMGKGYRKEGRKRPLAPIDDLDPMDPSAYSDAPRGGWYVADTYPPSAFFSLSYYRLSFPLMKTYYWFWWNSHRPIFHELETNYLIFAGLLVLKASNPELRIRLPLYVYLITLDTRLVNDSCLIKITKKNLRDISYLPEASR